MRFPTASANQACTVQHRTSATYSASCLKTAHSAWPPTPRGPSLLFGVSVCLLIWDRRTGAFVFVLELRRLFCGVPGSGATLKVGGDGAIPVDVLKAATSINTSFVEKSCGPDIGGAGKRVGRLLGRLWPEIRG